MLWGNPSGRCSYPARNCRSTDSRVSPTRASISSISSTSGFGSAMHQLVNASLRASSGPDSVKMSGQALWRNSSPSKRAREASRLRMARMARPVSSRAAWPTSTFVCTHRKSLPRFSRSRSAMRAEVLPVCRGACSTIVPFVPDHVQELVEIHPVQRRDMVVVLGADGAFRIESAHGSSICLSSALRQPGPVHGQPKRRARSACPS